MFLETALLTYDLDWVNRNIKENASINNAIIHDMYKRCINYLNILVQDYTANKMTKLISDLKLKKKTIIYLRELKYLKTNIYFLNISLNILEKFIKLIIIFL